MTLVVMHSYVILNFMRYLFSSYRFWHSFETPEGVLLEFRCTLRVGEIYEKKSFLYKNV